MPLMCSRQLRTLFSSCSSECPCMRLTSRITFRDCLEALRRFLSMASSFLDWGDLSSHAMPFISRSGVLTLLPSLRRRKVTSAPCLASSLAADISCGRMFASPGMEMAPTLFAMGSLSTENTGPVLYQLPCLPTACAGRARVAA